MHMELKMLSLMLTVLVLVMIYFVQQWHPVLAGILAVVPVKIVGTALITYDEGGIARLHDAVGGMLIGQVGWAVLLLIAWAVLR